MGTEVRRPAFFVLKKRMAEPRRFIQVLAGPRQTGKTTLARQLMGELALPIHYVSADEPTLQNRTWLNQQWEIARTRVAPGKTGAEGIVIVDEVHKVPGWSETVKRLWDEDTSRRLPLRVLLLGSSHLLVGRGLTESLTGRFEVLHVTHWSFPEMRDAFGWSLDQYLYFGGYPGAAHLLNDQERWLSYVLSSLVETTVSRDILHLSRVDKPALLRRLFLLGCQYSGQVLSYNKMLGQLQDAGNTTTLAHYLDLLEGAGLLCGLPKFSGSRVRQRGSSPKLLVMNMALMTAHSGLTFDEARADSQYWGRVVESAVGARLANSARGTRIRVFYWQDSNREVDYVLKLGRAVVAIEVKGGRRKGTLPGVEMLSRKYSVKRRLLVGSGGIPVEEFLLTPFSHWLP